MTGETSTPERGALWRCVASRLPNRLVGLALLALAPVAHAQEAADLASSFSNGVRCQQERATDDLSYNIARAGEADPIRIIDALTRLGADEGACEPMRLAAQTLASEWSTRTGSDQVNELEAARRAVDATLAEAERRAAAMKFEVGPPPLNLSRGKTGGS